MNDIPEAPARLTAPTRKGDPWTWRLLSCPHCGDQHTHGAGGDGTDGGHRSAHCSTGKERGGYFIVRAE